VNIIITSHRLGIKTVQIAADYLVIPLNPLSQLITTKIQHSWLFFP
jgi:hypothetical protein